LGTGATRVVQRDHHAAAHSSGFKHLKSFYHGFAEPLLRGYFPGMPCYEHFVALQKRVFVPLVVFLLSHLGTRTGLYYIDSTALATIIASTGTRSSPVWPSAARWAGSSASSCTLSSTTTMKSSL
jgi:hypothetical protein